jgi:hypothetical protein
MSHGTLTKRHWTFQSIFRRCNVTLSRFDASRVLDASFRLCLAGDRHVLRKFGTAQCESTMRRSRVGAVYGPDRSAAERTLWID